MARTDYEAFASEIIEAVGGKENVVSVVNCMTRLRFTLVDESIVDDEKVKSIKGVMSVVHGGGQYQIPIGTYVSELKPYVDAQLGGAAAKSTTEIGKEKAESMKVVQKDSWYNKFFKTISGCILPCIAPMATSGIIKGILTILVTANLLSNTSGTYLILYGIADTLMYFFPVFIGFAAGKVFGMNQYTAGVLGAGLLYPTLAAYAGSEEILTFLGMTVQMKDYSQTVLPIILAVFVASKVEKLAKKYIPQMLQLMFVPAVVLTICFPLTLLVVGPVMTGVSNLLAAGVNALFNTAPVLTGAILGAFWQLFVMMGIHGAMVPLIIINLTTLGYCPINAVLGLTVWALAGVALGSALRIKDKESKGAAFGVMASALCGITEPTIYMLALPNFKRFIASFIGGGISGLIAGFLGIKFYTWGGDGIFRIPSMINPAGLDISFYGFLICMTIAFVVSAVLAYFVTDPEEVING